MSSPATDHAHPEAGLQDSVRRISEHATALARLEAELAKSELTAKGKRLGLAAGLGAGAAILAVLGLAVGLGAAVVGLDFVMPLWAALLVVFGATLLVAAALAIAARDAARRATPPVPEQTIDEARRTKAAITEATNGR